VSLFKRSREKRAPETKLLFVTDIHGSDSVFRKSLNASKKFGVSGLVLGGDVTGKMFVPVIQENGRARIEVMGKEIVAETESEIAEVEKTLRMGGQYSFRTTPDEVAHLKGDTEARDRKFNEVMCDSVRAWFDLAEERLAPEGIEVVVISGNDDPWAIDEVLQSHSFVRCIDDDVVQLECGVEILGMGGSNATPFATEREYPEDEIKARVQAAAEKLSDPAASVWNVHVPPHNSELDFAPALNDDHSVIYEGGQARIIPVGSTAVRELIETYQPALGLHGHVHESKAMNTIGRTVVANPGSEYTEGVMRAAHVELTAKGPRVQFMAG
jgi:Icc-related predicted phosphoesterase